LQLETGGEYSFNINGANVTTASTDTDADVQTKLEAALGSGYEVYINTDVASADFAANSTDHATGDAIALGAGEFIIFHADAGKAINITQFQAVDGVSAGTEGTIRVAGGGTEAVLIDGSNQFTVTDDQTNTSEIDLEFTSVSSDYQVEIDGAVFLIAGDKLAAGTAGQALIDDLNSHFATGTTGNAAAGLGSLGNSNDDGNGAAAVGDKLTFDYEVVQNGSSISIKKAANAGDIVVKMNDVAAADMAGANLVDMITGNATAVKSTGNTNAIVVGTTVDVFDAVAQSTGSFFTNGADGDRVAASEIDLNVTGAAVFETQSATKTEATLTTSGLGSYSFKVEIGGSASGLITTAVSSTSASQMVADVNTALQVAGFTTTSAKIDPANSLALILEDTAGKSIKLTDFTSPSSETIQFSPGTGQGVASTLDDNQSIGAATAGAAGLADPTTASLVFDETLTDMATFKVTNGTDVATFRHSSIASADAADAQTEMRAALTDAGITDISVSVTAVANQLVMNFENSSGGLIKVFDFETDGLTRATFNPDAGQGAAEILDDNAATAATGKSVADLSVSTVAMAQAAIETIDNAIQQINDERGKLGAIQNRLDHTISNLGNIVVNTEAAQSRIEDADFASETSNLTKAQILTQAATAMLAQANASKQSVLSLLQG